MGGLTPIFEKKYHDSMTYGDDVSVGYKRPLFVVPRIPEVYLEAHGTYL